MTQSAPAAEGSPRNFNGIYVTIPDNWEDRSTIVLRSPDRQGGFRVNLVATRTPSDQEMGALVDKMREDLVAHPLPDLELGDARPASVDGCEALTFDARHTFTLDEGGEIKIALVSRYLIAVKNDTAHTFTFTDVAEFFAAHTSSVEDIIKSIRLP